MSIIGVIFLCLIGLSFFAGLIALVYYPMYQIAKTKDGDLLSIIFSIGIMFCIFSWLFDVESHTGLYQLGIIGSSFFMALIVFILGVYITGIFDEKEQEEK